MVRTIREQASEISAAGDATSELTGAAEKHVCSESKYAREGNVLATSCDASLKTVAIFPIGGASRTTKMSRAEIIEDSFSSDEEFDDDSVSESSTDVDAKVAEDDVFDVEFLKCYSALKKKDDKIYDPNVRFFTEKDSESENEGEPKNNESLLKQSSAPKMTLLDLQLDLTKGAGHEEQTIENSKVDLNQPVSKSYYEKELEEIKKSIEKVGGEIDSESDDDFLVVKGSNTGGAGGSKKRSKINSILDKIELEDDKDIEHLKQAWADPENLSDEDKYLRDYILNKRYLGNNVDEDSDDDKQGFFSKNLENLSDADSDADDKPESKITSAPHRSDEKDFDKITRIPRNSTKTIRDMVEKQAKKERRLKKLEKEKKRKKALKDADCEDIVGDLPTKFHYRETEPNDYGLTAEELLMATDEELDQWISLHECVAYRTEEQEKALKRKYEEKRHDIALKKKIFKSLYGDSSNPEQEQEPSQTSKSKKKRTRKRKRNTDSDSSLQGVTDTATTVSEQDEKSQAPQDSLSKNKLKKKKRKRGLNHKKFAAVGVAPDRLLAYGLSKTKLKKSKIM